MRVFDVDDVLLSADRAVEAYGADYVDPKAGTGACQYTYEDGRHCLGGWILKDWGFPIPGVGDDRNGGSVGMLVRELTLKGTVEADVTPDAERLLVTLQSDQDTGRTWGQARDAAYVYADALRIEAEREAA